MQARTADSARDIIHDIAWWDWTDPTHDRRVYRTIPGTEIAIAGVVNPETRVGQFPEYEFDIIPYSMSDQGPRERASSIMQIVTGFVIPTIQLFQAQGMELQADKILNLLADYTDLPELKDLFLMAGGPAVEDPNAARTGGAAPNKTTTSVRVNRPGSTRSGSDQATAKALMGTANSDEAASIGRATG